MMGFFPVLRQCVLSAIYIIKGLQVHFKFFNIIEGNFIIVDYPECPRWHGIALRLASFAVVFLVATVIGLVIYGECIQSYLPRCFPGFLQLQNHFACCLMLVSVTIFLLLSWNDPTVITHDVLCICQFENLSCLNFS